MKFCNFCAKNHEKFHKITENILTIANKTVRIIDGFEIFQNDITKFLLDNLDSIICTICLQLLKNSCEFVQQIKEAEKKLSLARDVKNEHDYFETEKKVKGKVSEINNVTVNANLRLKLDESNCKLKFIPILPKPSTATENPKKESIANEKSSRLYKCLECIETFKSFKHLREHEQRLCKNSTFKGVYTCNYCHVCYNKEQSLNEHHSENHAKGLFHCYLCKDKIFTAKGYLTRHIDKVHQHKSLQYFCGECKEMVVIPHKEDLHKHFLQKHPLEPQKISVEEHQVVDDLNDDDMDLEMHEEFLDEFLLAHTNENSFQFSECWEALDLHLPDMLQGNSTNLNTSQEFSEAYPCPKCFEQFKNPQPLLQHLAENHNLPVLICRICRKSFPSLKDFKIHKQKKCLQTSATEPNLSLNCPYCSKTFKNSLNLKQHLRIVHTQLKRHICQLCDKQFSTVDHLKKHVLSQHQNERKHVCNVCNKTFTQLGHLKQHLAIHTTGKEIQCPECSTKFWRKIDLKRHLQKKHYKNCA